jgi:release factor glutamine methyltransferase
VRGVLPLTRRELWLYGRDLLSTLSQPALEARLLLQKAAGIDEKEFFLSLDQPVEEALVRRYEYFLRRRLKGWPLALVVGEKEFWSLPFKLQKGVFIPRPETECLVELALKLPWPEDGIAVDIGTGCGAIACSLAKERPASTVVATDISRRALALAQKNASRLGLKNIIFRLGSFFSPLAQLDLTGRCDLIVSNPPYVAEEEWPRLPEGIRLFEPKRGLVAGPTGLEFIFRLIRDAPQFLRPGGYLIFEIGFDQLAKVLSVGNKKLWREITWEKDLAGIPRVMAWQLHPDFRCGTSPGLD